MWWIIGVIVIAVAIYIATNSGSSGDSGRDGDSGHHKK